MNRNASLLCGVLVLCLAACTAAGDEAAGASNALARADGLRAQAREMIRDGRQAEARAILTEASRLYEQILKHEPYDLPASRGLAMTLLDLGDFEVSRGAPASVSAPTPDGATALVAAPAPAPAPASTVPAVPPATQAAAPSSVAPAATLTNAVAVAGNPPPAATLTNAPPAEGQAVAAAIPAAPVRGVEIPLDFVFSRSPSLRAENLAKVVERIVALDVNTVYLDVCGAPGGDGATDEVYFENGLIPVKAPLAAPLAAALRDVGVAVHVVMPLLSFGFGESDSYRRMLVMEWNRTGPPRASSSWRKRLSPFNADAQALAERVFEEMAQSVPLDGVVFDADGYLTDKEDLNPSAVFEYERQLDIAGFNPDTLSGEQRAAWTAIKTERLNAFCAAMQEAVKRHRPDATFARALFAPALHHPKSQAWLAQSSEATLASGVSLVALVDPELEGAGRRTAWTRSLVADARGFDPGLDRVVFRVQTYSYGRRDWISSRDIAGWVRTLREAGARHIVCAPDDFLLDRPRAASLRKTLACH